VRGLPWRALRWQMALPAVLDSAVCARWKSRVIPLRLLLPALAIAAAGLGGIRAGAWYVQSQWDKESAAELAAQIDEEARRREAMQEVTRYAAQSRARILADSGAAAAAADRLRHQVRALLAQRAVAAPGSETTGDSCGVLTELLGAAETRLRELARIADERGAAGAACVRAYESLTK